MVYKVDIVIVFTHFWSQMTLEWNDYYYKTTYIVDFVHLKKKKI